MSTIDITLVLPDGTRQPLTLPASAPSGAVAAQTAATLAIPMPQGSVPVFVVSGVTVAPEQSLQAAGVAADAELVLSAMALPVPWWKRSSVVVGLGSGALGLVLLVVLLVVLLGGSDDAGKARLDAPPRSQTTATAGERAREAVRDSKPTKKTSLGNTKLVDRPELVAFSASLPSGWNMVQREVLEGVEGPITRQRTKVVAPTGGTTVIIDDLRGSSLTAEQNSATVRESAPARLEGYRFSAYSKRELPRATAYEWRYEHFDPEKGRRVRKANVMFTLGDHLFAVLVTGSADVQFAELSLLARRVARTVKV